MASFRKKISTKFRNRYRLIIRQDENLEERVSFVLTPLNVVLVASVSLLVFGALLYVLLAYTPLNYLFPTKSTKYSNMEQYAMLQRIDSLEQSLYSLKLQSDNLKQILGGDSFAMEMPTVDPVLESVIRSEGGSPTEVRIVRSGRLDPRSYNLFLPLKGVVTDTFDLERKHLAVDIAAKEKEVVKSVQKGTVIFSDWTPSGGHTLVIQHPNELISVYKHNAVLLKKEGTFVNAGDAVALVGNTGELSTGPHLHFELWNKGVAVNPGNYINF